MTDQPDIPKAIQDALAHLRAVDAALPDLYEHRYSDEWQPERVGGAQTPRSRPAWHGHTALHKSYLEVTRELSRAHWALGRNTDVDEHWTSDCHEVPLDTARTEPVVVVLWASRLLADNLLWLAGELDNLMPPERSAVLEACGHAHAAAEQVPHGFGDRRERERAIRVCVHCERAHTGERPWCKRCEQCHRPGGSCRVCTEAAA